MQPWFVKALAGWLTKLCPFFSGQFSWESERDECTDGETLDSRREERKGSRLPGSCLRVAPRLSEQAPKRVAPLRLWEGRDRAEQDMVRANCQRRSVATF